MPKLSAGIIPYRLTTEGGLEVFLVHPGGPFWKNKDEGAWSIPKGEYDEGADPLEAAKREFAEETGSPLPVYTKYLRLDPVKIKSGKIITAWAAEAEVDATQITSNYFEMEWPPRSGKTGSFPEVDKAGWFSLPVALQKINAGQVGLIEQLQKVVQV